MKNSKTAKLNDAQAICYCDKWYFARTGMATKEEIETEYQKHLWNVHYRPKRRAK